MSIPFKLLAPQDILEAYYANVQRSKTIYMVMLDTNGKVIASNRATAGMFGKSPDEFLGTDWFAAVIPGKNREELRGIFAKLLATGLPEIYENPVQLPDGTSRSILWSNTLTRDGDRLTGTLSFGIDVTELKQKERSLRVTSELLVAAEEAAGLGTYVLDVASGHWTSSSMMDRIFGIGPENPRTIDSWVQLVHPDDRREMMSYFQTHVLAHKNSFDRIYRIIRPSDGVTRWVHGYGALKLNADGSVGTMSGAILDITETHNAFSRLQLADMRFRIAAQQSHALVYDWDISADTLAWEGSIRQITGFDPDEFPARSIDGWAELIHPEDRAVALELLEKARQSGTRYEVRYRLRRKDGSYATVEDTGAFIVEQARQASRMIGVMRDITTDQQREDKVREAELKFRTIFERASVCIARVGMDKKFLDANPAFESFTGYSIDELRTKTIADITHPDDQRVGMDELGRIAAGTLESATVEKRYVSKDGSVRWGRTAISLVRNPDGSPAYFLPFIRDITAEKVVALRREEEISDIELANRELSLIARTAKIGYWTRNLRTGTGRVSRSAYELLGLPPQETTDLSEFMALFPAGSRASLEKAAAEVARVGTTFDMTVPYVAPDGRKMLLRLVNAVEKDPASGKPLNSYGIIQDVTDHASATQASIRPDQQAAQIIDSMSEGFAEHEMIFDAEGNAVDYRFISVNPAFERLTGLQASKILGKTVKEVLPGTEDIWIRRSGEVVKTGVPTSFTSVSKEVGGKSFHISEWRTAPNRFAVIFTDVTESEKRASSLESVMDHALDSIVIITPTGTCTYQNATSLPMLGFDPSEMVGTNLLTHIHPDDMQKVTAAIAAGLAEPGKAHRVTYRFRHKNGTWLELESVGLNLIDDPQVNGILVFSRDITEVVQGREAKIRAEELESMNRAMVGRELRIDELKKEVQRLKDELARVHPK